MMIRQTFFHLMTSMVWKLFWNRCKYKLLSELLFSVNNFLFSSFIILSKVLNKTKKVESRLNYKLRFDVLHSVSRKAWLRNFLTPFSAKLRFKIAADFRYINRFTLHMQKHRSVYLLIFLHHEISRFFVGMSLF